MEWRSAKLELPSIELGLVIVYLDAVLFDEWARESDDNQRFYDDNFRTAVDVWNTLAVAHWANETGCKWLTHWMPLPSEPQDSSSTGQSTESKGESK